jgi:hypothetical protein
MPAARRRNSVEEGDRQKGRVGSLAKEASSISELQKHKLSGVLRRIIAKQYRVRERDLH